MKHAERCTFEKLMVQETFIFHHFYLFDLYFSMSLSVALGVYYYFIFCTLDGEFAQKSLVRLRTY